MSWVLGALPMHADSWPGIWTDLVLKSSFVLALAGSAKIMLKRRSAATRHFVWMMAFAGLALLPCFWLALPTWPIDVGLRAGPAPAPQALLFSSPSDPNQPPTGAAFVGSLAPSQLSSANAAPAHAASASTSLDQALEANDRGALESLALYGWALGCVLCLIPSFGGYLNLARLRARAHRAQGSRAEKLAQSLAKQLDIRRDVTVLISDRSCMPMTWGLFRPVVMLPLAAQRWSIRRLRAVLVHELAHVRRSDALTQLLVQLVRAVYWYNPLVWIAHRHLRLEQEAACDDIVLNAGLDPQEYATQLLSITAGLPSQFLTSSVALAMAKKRTLEQRLLAILDAARDRREPKRHVLVLATTTLIASVALLSPIRLLVGQPEVDRAAASIVSLDSITKTVDQQTLSKTLDDVRSKIQSLAVNAPAEKVLLEGALRGMLEAMQDPYSSYLPASDAIPMDPSQASMVGVGIQVQKVKQGITVISPLPHSPARKAGLKAGDLILAVDGKPTSNMAITDAVNQIRGPISSTVELKIRSAGAERLLSVVRAPVTIPSVQGFERTSDDGWSYLIDAETKIGYVQIVAFNGGTAQEFQQTLQNLNNVGMRGLVLDLRFCPGGMLNSTIGVAQMLLEQGSIVTLKGRDMREQTARADGAALLGQKPLVVLVNEQTASGGEILAGALKENNRAIVIGSRTLGKGSVQTVVNLGGEKGAIKLTTAQLYLPEGRMIQKTPGATEWGVDPTDGFYIHLSAKQLLALEERFKQRQLLDQQPAPKALEDPADPQLAAALKTMTAKLTRGEFEKVGRPIAELAGDLENVQAERLRLKKQLAEIERELEVLGGKEPKNS